ncbi:protein BREAST CANCER SUSCEPTIBILITY 1-like [Quillaja saponaria]|uniref:Protein BREAST CANCER SUSCEPTIBILITY 1-like n=1 Tax=Quillaja saponaria TaxID=32244 RepID=A0AAD7PV54_QUISA|nr:protein BREAST CANCER SUSCEPTIBILITY 1-like [Quillaja saponaria]
MEDTIHLEKMGRELKCPICLSLLNSAVSLTCNHVFCNSCIVKSMKSASSCPVCKVPFRRREVRPAPHMDNLVSIYKNMEVASGINIFVTQNVPSTKVADGEKQDEGGAKCDEKDTDDTRGSHSLQKKGL